MKRFLIYFILILLVILPPIIKADEDEDENGDKEKQKELMNSGTFSGLKWRLIGPSLTGGRITDIITEPGNDSHFWVAVACGGVWKTTNHGQDFIPVFDSQGSYSIGCLAMDPNNPNVVWVGTGENNSQRSVAYGDGVYKTIDGGKTWKDMGLKHSEHIGKIVINPENSDIVYVAAQGPLWGPGGDRGLYKTTDGGATWEKVLDISENTGVNEVVMDPRYTNVLYASSYQRRRHVWTLIDGGPESAIYKSTDAGKSWNKLTNGIPGGDKGRIGLAISPSNPDYVYSIIEAEGNKGGFFRSTDRGASWNKMGNYKTTSAQYYNEIICDPYDPDRVYALNTITMVTEDGGKTFHSLGNRRRHVDDHALWIDNNNTGHMLIGCDGGVYETYDRGSHWRFFPNLPITQFYRVGLDNSKPFYYVYGGTQDNNTYGGPSGTINSDGIKNENWFKVVGGDGFQARVDPDNPNIVYGQPQYGVLVRFDRKSGEMVYIKPQEKKGEELRWNWNSPLIISPHKATRLYFAANKVFRSDDRGNSWMEISGDLTRQINRNELEIMGKVWPPEAVAKNASTSLYGNIVSLCESPVQEGLIYAGTDDGLIQVTEDNGKNWYRADKFPGVPETTYVSDIYASNHDAATVYASFDNHKRADFKPYILKSTDKGRTWVSVSGNLPENGPVYTIYEDRVNPNLLFAGTEFGFYFTVDGGKKWIELNSGLPTIAVRDMEIQQRENDLVIATFGRSFYVLDNYTPLRTANEELLKKDAHIFPVKDALIFSKDNSTNRSQMGETAVTFDNPPYGATITYYLKESIKTLKQKRQEKEKEYYKEQEKDKKKKKKDDQKFEYPSWQELRAEDLEPRPFLLFVISDDQGNVVRRLSAPASKGIHRITWDLEYSGFSPVTEKTDPYKNGGMPAFPGQYSVTMYKSVDGNFSKLAGPVSFDVKLLQNRTLPDNAPEASREFKQKAAKMWKAILSSNRFLSEQFDRIGLIEKALVNTPEATNELFTKVNNIKSKLEAIKVLLHGNSSISKRNGNQPPSINDRIQGIVWGAIGHYQDIPQTFKDQYDILKDEFGNAYKKLISISETDIKQVEDELQKLNAPWTPGRIPQWNPE